jgi:hypothetical protein
MLMLDHPQDEKEEELTFTFDRVFYEDSIQADVFETVALPIVKGRAGICYKDP